MRVVFMGSPPFAVSVFERLLASAHECVALVTRPDRPHGRGQKVRASPLVTSARERGIRVLQPERSREPGFVDDLRALAPDALLVASYGEILKQDVLDVPRLGCLNVHASLLPRWRGAAPIQAAILAGDAETGVSIQRMVLALDEGDVLVEARTPIGERESAGALLERLAVMGGTCAVSALDALERGKARFRPQDSAHATYVKKIRKEDGRIDWTKRAVEIDRLVRAFTPWPGARTTAPNGAELAILEVRRRPEISRSATTPGNLALFRASSEGRETLLVGASDGPLELVSVKPAGKGALDGLAWWRGARIELPARLGARAEVP